MNFKNLLRVLACALLLSFVTGCNRDEQSKPAQRSASEVLEGLRLKQLTKMLELTEDQKGQVKALLDAEGKEIAKLQDEANSPTTEQASRISELQKETYGKIKPLLTPVQLEKLEKMLSNREKRKKTN